MTAMLPAGRVPPNDLAAERELINCCLLDPDSHAELVHAVEPGDFYRDAHGLIWEALRELDREHVRADAVTLRERVARAGRLQRVGGDEYLGELFDSIPTLDNGEYFAERVRQLAAVRAVITASHEIAAEGYAPIEDVPDYLARAERALSKAVDGRAVTSEPVPVADAVHEAMNALVARAGGEGTPVSTGLSDFDFALGGGLWPGEVTYLAGSPGTGKTALAIQIARTVEQARGTVLFFSLEMPKRQLAARLLSQEAKVDGNRIRMCRLTGEEMQRVVQAGEAISRGNLLIEDSSGVSIGDVARHARRTKRRKGLMLVVVDYVQLLRATVRNESREREVNEISKDIKRLARDLDVPLLGLCSLNRGSGSTVGRNADRRPTMHQLRESGALESDADNVILLYRDDLINPQSEKPGQCDAIIGKQRNGMTGDVTLRFVKEHTRFENLERWREGQ